MADAAFTNVVTSYKSLRRHGLHRERKVNLYKNKKKSHTRTIKQGDKDDRP